MKSQVLSILLFAPLFGTGQKVAKLSTDSLGASETGVELIGLIEWRHLKNDFSFGDGRVSYGFRFDSTHNFKYIESGCLTSITLDEGKWRTKGRNHLVLKSKNNKRIFELIKFGNFLFLISPDQRDEFIRDLRIARDETANFLINENETRYTREFFIAFRLRRKYYGEELI